MWNSFIIFLLIADSFYCRPSVDGPTVRNIGFLGRGYDIVRGNPRPIDQYAVDSGIVSPIFDMNSYETGRRTADLEKVVPDAADVIDCATCLSTFQTDVISGAKSYKQSLNHQIDLNADGVFELFSFRASKAYQRTMTETATHGNVLVDTMAYCVAYCADLRMPTKYATFFDPDFVEAVKQLPEKGDSPDYLLQYHLFIEQYGTHYISSIKAGSLYWQRATFSSVDYHSTVRTISSMGGSLEAAAIQGFLLGGKFSGNSSSDSSFASNFSHHSESILKHSIGVVPPANVTPISWLEEASKRPMPIAMRLVPVTTLLTEMHFPDASIDFKRRQIEELTEPETYCKYLAATNPDDGINCDDIEPRDAIGPPDGVFGGTYYMGYSKDFENLPNPFTDKWDCPVGFLPHKVAGRYGDPEQGNYVLLSGHLYVCLQKSWNFVEEVDPEGSFGGMYSVSNYQNCVPDSVYNYVPNPVLKSGTSCPKSYSAVVVARLQSPNFKVCEFIIACYRHVENATLGGFFLKPAETFGNIYSSWVNPATGVSACPVNYTAQLMLSTIYNGVPFKSYYCLKN